MKGLLLAIAMSVGCFLLITALFRLDTIRQRAALMTRIHLASVPLLVGLHLGTPADLWILPASAASPALELLFGLLLYVAGYFGGILQLYNLADRGFSLRVLIDIDAQDGRRVTLDELCRGYSAGRGLGWMYDKRIADLREHGLAELCGDELRASERGIRAAALFDWLRRFLHIDESG